MSVLKNIKINMEKQYYRVLSSTYSEDKGAKKMIGGIFEAKTILFHEKTISLWTNNKKDFWWFNFSDVQKVFPGFEIDGHVLGVGDEVTYYSEVAKVEYCFEDTFVTKGVIIRYDDGSTCTRILEDLTFSKSLYNPTQTTEYNGKKYNKAEFEKAISSLKEVK